MKVRFNHFERVAGVFVTAAIVGSVAATVGMGVKRGWFARKIEVYTQLPTADGVYAGTQVQMSGLRAGEVDEVKLMNRNNVRVRILVKEEFFRRLSKGSQVMVVRPFVIGEKVLDLTPGEEGDPQIEPGASLEVAKTVDLMDILNGRTLGSNLATLGKLADSMRLLAEAFGDPERIGKLIEVIDSVQPMLKNLNDLSQQVIKLTKRLNRSDDLDHVLANTRVLTDELNKILPEMNKGSPTVGRDMALMATNLSSLTNEFAKLVPLIQQMAPQFPKASGRALEALDETVVTLKAIQRSFILRSAAREVREEESKKAKEKEEAAQIREPAAVESH